MKTLLTIALFFTSFAYAHHGIERHVESPSASQYTWAQIHRSATLTADRLTFKSPSKSVSLFNVCNYNDNQFKVLLPKRKCTEYKEMKVGGKPGEVEEVCVNYVRPKQQLIKNTKTTCVKSENVETGKTRRDSIITKKCLEYGEVPVPQTQLVDVYKDMRNYSYEFSKLYTIPDCSDSGKDLPDSELPDTGK